MSTQRDTTPVRHHPARWVHRALWVLGAGAVAAVAAAVGLAGPRPADRSVRPAAEDDPLGPPLACAPGEPYVRVVAEVVDTAGGPATPEEEVDRFLAQELPGLDRRSLRVEARAAGRVAYVFERDGAVAARFSVDDVGDSWHVAAHAACEGVVAGARR